MTRDPIYLDHHATTPLDPGVLARMATTPPGNPHSTHTHGRAAAQLVQQATGFVADLIGALPREVVFTPGATFSNNLAVFGAARALQHSRRKIIVSQIEHPCVLEPARRLVRDGFCLLEAPVNSEGFVDLNWLQSQLDQSTALVSIILANNEVGVVQPLAQISQMTKRVGALLHTDAAQAVGRMAVDVDELGVDLMSFTAHKMYGPSGIGALFVRDGLQIEPVTLGGGQQSLQSGTLPTHLCVGFGEACRLANTRLSDDTKYIRELRDRLWSGLKARLPQLELNGTADLTSRLPGNLNIFVPGADMQELMALLAPGVSVSAGAACASSKGRYSHVLAALGFEEHRQRCSMRIGVGRTNTLEDIDLAIEAIVGAVELLLSEQHGGEIH